MHLESEWIVSLLDVRVVLNIAWALDKLSDLHVMLRHVINFHTALQRGPSVLKLSLVRTEHKKIKTKD